jgi:hypothetical protein
VKFIARKRNGEGRDGNRGKRKIEYNLNSLWGASQFNET